MNNATGRLAALNLTSGFPVCGISMNFWYIFGLSLPTFE